MLIRTTSIRPILSVAMQPSLVSLPSALSMPTTAGTTTSSISLPTGLRRCTRQATQVRQKPDVCGIDGVRISDACAWGSYISGHYYFYGTSAAAPSIAALAAQSWAAHPDMTASQVRTKLLSSAVDLGTAGYDNVFGNGRGDAVLMQQAMPRATITGFVDTQYLTRIADAYVTLVNATNSNIVYASTRTDSQGNYNLADIEVIDGMRYRVRANTSLLGEGYSNSFTLADMPSQVHVIIQTLPYQIQLTTNKSAVDISPDVIEVSAYVTDALNHAPSAELTIVFTLNNSLGFFAAADGTATDGDVFMTASTSGGYAKVRYGWAASEGATRITAAFVPNQSVNAFEKRDRYPHAAGRDSGQHDVWDFAERRGPGLDYCATVLQWRSLPYIRCHDHVFHQ